MRTNFLLYGFRTLAAGIGAALMLGAPAVAQARTELLRWTHPNAASVASFAVYFGTAPLSYGGSVNAGKPSPDSAGVYSFSIQIPASLENETLHFAVTAIGEDGQESSFSNEKIRTPAGEPEPPPPEPAPEPLGQPGRPTLVP